MSAEDLTQSLKHEALRLGFDLVGACPAVTPPGIERFRRWLEAGRAGQMRYLADRAEAYAHPRHVLQGVRSLLMLGIGYRTADPAPPGAGQGTVSRYAWGRDYHDLVHEKLHHLADFHRRQCPQAAVRGVVDTAPLLERDFAQLAGLGWIGKNTLLLNRKLGSWLFLAAMLTSEPLDYDEPLAAGYCGTCRACLDACPTGALVAPYQLDARRCISYLTIELADLTPRQFREPLGARVFGCDACQEVCPWNRRAPTSDEPTFQPAAGMNPIELVKLLSLDEAGFRRRFRHVPLWRAKRRGLLSHAAIVLGNRPDPAAESALVAALDDVEPIVRAASAWALGRYRTAAAAEALQHRLDEETDAVVQSEIRASLADRC